MDERMILDNPEEADDSTETAKKAASWMSPLTNAHPGKKVESVEVWMRRHDQAGIFGDDSLTKSRRRTESICDSAKSFHRCSIDTTETR